MEYIQANRIRYRLIQEINRIFESFDVIVTPSFGGDQLLMTNLTGHPCVVVPNGFKEDLTPTSITFLGALFGEASILLLAKDYQDVTGFDEQHPPLFR